MSFKKEIIQTSKVFIIAIAFFLGVQFIFAWSEPAGGPPGSNVSTPINTSGTDQVKNGGLSVGALVVTGGASIGNQIIGGLGAVTTAGTLNWNDVSNIRSGSGYTLLMGNAANGPGPGYYFHTLNFEYSSKNGSGNITQLAIPYGSPGGGGNIYMRGSYGGVWSAWSQVGSGAGIYLPLAGGTLNTSSNVYFSGGTAYGIKSNDVHLDTLNTGVTNDPLEINYRTAGPVKICASTGCATYSAIFNTDKSVSIGGVLTASANVINSNPTQGWIGLTGDLPGYATGVYPTLKTNGAYLYFSANGAYSGYWYGADFHANGTAYANGYALCQSNGTNCPSGASFSPGTSYTWTGLQYFQTNNGGYAVNNSSSAALQAYSTGNNSAFMSFHKGGYYAVNFGLDADNVLRIGGWSAAANRWQLDMSGNQTVAGGLYAGDRVQATIFYDANNTGYYVDPSSNSYISALQVAGGSLLSNWPGYPRGIQQTDGAYVYPGFVSGQGSGWNTSYYLAGSTSWGLYTNTSLNAAGGLYDQSRRVATSRGEGTNYIDYSRYVYNNGAYSGSGWVEPSSLGVYYAYLGRLAYNNGAYSGSGWVEPSDLGVRYANSAGSASYANSTYGGGNFSDWPNYADSAGYASSAGSAPVTSNITKLNVIGAGINTSFPGAIMCSTTGSAANAFLLYPQQIVSGYVYYYFVSNYIYFNASTGAAIGANISMYCYTNSGTWPATPNAFTLKNFNY